MGRGAAAQSAEAQELFEQGRRALATKDYAAACAKFEASDHIERAVGTLLSLAECEEALGRLANARLHLQEAATWADATHDPANRGRIARARFEEIDKRVPRLTLKLAPDAPRDSHATRDGVDLGDGAFGATLPVDPGKHVVVVSASGRPDGRFEVVLKEGDQQTLQVGPGALSTPSPVATNAASAAAPPSATQEPAAASPDGTPGSSRRTWAYVTGGLGIVGIGLGTYFGVTSLSTWSQAKKDCGSGCGAGKAQSERSDALTDATVSTIAFAAGGAALAIGAYLFFTAPSGATPATGIRLTPWVGARAGGASVSGGW
jgi:hypothetical protein